MTKENSKTSDTETSDTETSDTDSLITALLEAYKAFKKAGCKRKHLAQRASVSESSLRILDQVDASTKFNPRIRTFVQVEKALTELGYYPPVSDDLGEAA